MTDALNNKAQPPALSLPHYADSAVPGSQALGHGDTSAESRVIGEAGWTRRPITDHERIYLEALGREVMRLRRQAGLSRAELADAAGFGESSVARIERGTRRTTAVRLERMAAVLAPPFPGESVNRIAARLVEMAGPALAPPASAKALRAERHKERRQRRQRQIREEAAVLAERLYDERVRRAEAWRNR